MRGAHGNDLKQVDTHTHTHTHTVIIHSGEGIKAGQTLVFLTSWTSIFGPQNESEPQNSRDTSRHTMASSGPSGKWNRVLGDRNEVARIVTNIVENDKPQFVRGPHEPFSRFE